LATACPGCDGDRLAGASGGAHEGQRAGGAQLEVFLKAWPPDKVVSLRRDLEILHQEIAREEATFPVSFIDFEFHDRSTVRAARTAIPSGVNRARAQPAGFCETSQHPMCEKQSTLNG